MSNQIFKKQIPNELLFNLFEVLCIKNEKYYLFTINSFKKGIFTQLINKFLEDCKPNYHISKYKYL